MKIEMMCYRGECFCDCNTLIGVVVRTGYWGVTLPTYHKRGQGSLDGSKRYFVKVKRSFVPAYVFHCPPLLPLLPAWFC